MLDKTPSDQPLVITLILKGDEGFPTGTRGVGYVSQVFSEAGMQDHYDNKASDQFWQRIRILNRNLQREFGDKVTLAMLNPWTPRGLWFVMRHRVRQFPVLVIKGQCYPIDSSTNELIDIVHNYLK